MFVLLLTLAQLSFIIVFAMRHRRKSSRFIAIMPMLCFIVLALLSAGFVFEGIQPPGRFDALNRLSDTWQRLRDAGIERFLFEEDPRALKNLLAVEYMIRMPIAGQGPGGFYRECANATLIHTGVYSTTQDSALNHYLVIGCDLGLPALILNLVLIAVPLLAAIRLTGKASRGVERFSLAVIAAVNVSFLIAIVVMPVSYYPDVIWVWTGQLAYLVTLRAASQDSLEARARRKSKVAFSLGIAAILIVGIGSSHAAFGPSGYRARQDADWWPQKYYRNCYPKETWEIGTVRWCRDDASIQIPILRALPDTIRFGLAVHHPDVHTNAVKVGYGGKSGIYGLLTFNDKMWKTVEVPVTEDHVFEPNAIDHRQDSRWFLLPSTTRRLREKYALHYLESPPFPTRFFVLRLSVSRTWLPREHGIENDARDLGVAVLLPEL
jgi:hypothetical protein